MKDKDHALADFDRAIELNPAHAAGYNSRGFLYLSEGDFDRALSDYDRAIELQPRYAKALVGRAQANLKKGEPAKGLARYRSGAVARSRQRLCAQCQSRHPGRARPSQRSHRRIQEGARHRARSAGERAGIEGASARQALTCARYAALAWTRPAALASAPGTSSSASSRAGSTGPGSAICPRGTGTKPNLP